jgi:histidine transport system substrate-binding protein
MSSLSITEKRQQEIAFTDKLYAADSRLVVKKGSDITPDLAKLKGKRVGVLQGYHPGNLRQRALGAERH